MLRLESLPGQENMITLLKLYSLCCTGYLLSLQATYQLQITGYLSVTKYYYLPIRPKMI